MIFMNFTREIFGKFSCVSTYFLLGSYIYFFIYCKVYSEKVIALRYL